MRVEVRFSAGANENPMDFYHLDQNPSAAIKTTAGRPVSSMDLSHSSSSGGEAGGGGAVEHTKVVHAVLPRPQRSLSMVALAASTSENEFDYISKEIKAAEAALRHPDGRVGGAELEAAIGITNGDSSTGTEGSNDSEPVAAGGGGAALEPEPGLARRTSQDGAISIEES